MTELNKDTVSRLAAAFLEKEPTLLKEHGDRAFEIIDAMLNELRLEIYCGKEIRTSLCLQAALITAINVGKRCYKGGVFINLPQNTPSLLPLSHSKSLNEIAFEMGAQPKNGSGTVKIHFGHSEDRSNWRVIANNWTAVIVPPDHSCPSLIDQNGLSLGGTLAGALGVALTFLRYAGFDYSIGSEVIGLSLWRPDLHWSDELATGPMLIKIPDQIWMLGLGHLGQAYAWVIGLLSFSNPKEMCFKLQDSDKIVPGNYDSGMLSEYIYEGKYKTRIVSGWLEARGLQTRIVERRYDKLYHRQEEFDPAIMLSGLDNIETRRNLKYKEFQLLIDCGVGAGLDFDLIRLNVFPNNALTPETVWATQNNFEQNPNVKAWASQFTQCGFTVGIASAFTGCVAACFSVSELIRCCNNGIKLSHAYISLRELQSRIISSCGTYQAEVLTSLTALK